MIAYARAARTALLAASALALAGCGRGAVPPSVVLITIDTLRADHLGCYGYRRATSPAIDRLASEGAAFDRAYTSLPRTTQSIASILTGRYPKGHGARGLFSIVPATNLMLAEALKGSGYDTGAVVSNVFLRPGQGFEQGFDLYDNPEGRWDGDSATEVTAAALRFLEGRAEARPFFLWAHYLDPHWTYLPSPPFDGAFDPAFRGPLTLYDDLRRGRLTKGQVIFQDRVRPREAEHLVALYDGEIAQVDAAVAPLLERLRRWPGPLLVVLTSDHGESLGEHGYRFAHGEYLYDQTLRVPLVVWMPGRIPAGLRADGLAQNIDVAPTILSLLGIDRLQGADGRPLFVPDPAAAARGPGMMRPAPGRAIAFAESDYQLIHPENPRYYIRGPLGKWSAATDGRFKLIHIPSPGGAILELYDLLADPGETRNLAGADGPGDGAAGPERDAALEAQRRLLREVRRFVDYEAGPAGREAAPLDPADRERLRSLGYIN